MNKQLEINEHFKVTFPIFIVLLAVILMFCAISIWIVRSSYFEPDTDLDKLLQILIPALGLTMTFISSYIYINQVGKVDEKI